MNPSPRTFLAGAFCASLVQQRLRLILGLCKSGFTLARVTRVASLSLFDKAQEFRH